ncbi:MAG TPA: cyclic pyranopterin monophosphate synthase MoaC [Rhizomicrobium sp.]
MNRLTHLDQTGAARMVDVSEKVMTAREASAEAIVAMAPETFAEIATGRVPKGDLFAASRIAGIMAAKKTHELIPLCHQIPLAAAEIAFEPLPDRNAIRIVATTKTNAQTGVEMEALTAASIAALTIYDMVKAMDRGIVIETVRLLAKSGGRSGAFRAPVLPKAGKPPVTS